MSIGQLTTKDLKELQSKRGLSEDIIEKYQLYSIQDKNDLDEIGYGDVFMKNLKSTIVIPYQNGEHYIHKQHRTGLTYPLFEAGSFDSDSVVIAESPLKAIASDQLGISAVGLQGVTSFVNRTEELTDFINNHNTIQNVYVLLDSEYKFQGFDKDYTETQCRQLQYAKVLERELPNHNIKIATLPSDYGETITKDDGRSFVKVDIDGALANGMSNTEYITSLLNGVGSDDYPISPMGKLITEYRLRGLNILKDNNVGGIIAQLDDVMEAVDYLCFQIKDYCFKDKVFDNASCSLHANRLKSLLSSIGEKIPISVLRNKIKNSIRDDDQTQSQGNFSEGEDGVYYNSSSGQNLICNFSIKEIEVAHNQYLSGSKVDTFYMTLDIKGEEVSVYWSQGYENVCSITKTFGKLMIIDQQKFKQYFLLKEKELGCNENMSKSITYFIGIVKNAQGAYESSLGLNMPHLDEECPYSGVEFNEDGDYSVLNEIASLQKNDSIRVLLLHLLGAPLKVPLGNRFPHLSWEADTGVGKDTICGQLNERIGIKTVGALEFDSTYRAKKNSSNASIPLIVSEAGRVNSAKVQGVINMMNDSYDVKPTSHGNHDKKFVLSIPLMLVGQDTFASLDSALSAKTIFLYMKEEDKEDGALKNLTEKKFPYGQWVSMLANICNKPKVDVVSITNKFRDRLKERLEGVDYIKESNTDRTFWNYAVLLTTEKLLNLICKKLKVNVKFDVEDYLVEMLTEHLKPNEGDFKMTIAKKFVYDLISCITMPSMQGKFKCKYNNAGLYFMIKESFDTLQAMGKNYDISTSNMLGKNLKSELGALGKQSVTFSNGSKSKNAYLIPMSSLRENGLDDMQPCDEDDSIYE